MAELSNPPDSLHPVVGIDPTRCVSCHACISACPVKFCNDGSGERVTLSPSLCIGCGTCLAACTHGARYHIDDFAAFLSAIEAGEPILAIAAPSVAANFPGQYLHLNGWLKQLGVAAIFDVSFGAELSVKSYVEYIRTQSPEVVIAQPCPAIVAYIQVYHPELIPYLAPVESPMQHCMRMIRRYYPQYNDHRIMVLSPCIAKKREFEASGLGDYNVGYISIAQYLKDHDIDLARFPETSFDNPPAERAVLFSTPGGLRRSIARWLPELAEETRKIEGAATVYEYLAKLSEAIAHHRAPRLIDCLSCSLGCNGGPLTLTRDIPLDEVEHWIEKRNQELQALYRQQAGNQSPKECIEALLAQFWEPGLYTRNYQDLSANNPIAHPNPEEQAAIFRRMHKYSEKDIYNCTACGYMTCRDMAVAIFNGKNRPENCHFYLAKETAISHEEILDREQRFRQVIETSLEGFVQFNANLIIEIVNDAFGEMLAAAPAALVGKPLLDFIETPARHAFTPDALKAAANERRAIEIKLRRHDGSWMTALMGFSNRTASNGDWDGAFALITDITQIKETEAALRRSRDELEQRVAERTSELAQSNTIMREEIEHRRQAEHALRDSESRLQAIVHGCPVAQFVIDRDHKVILWNKPLEEFTGIREEDILGTNDQWRAFYEHPRPCLADLLLTGHIEQIAKWYAGKYAPHALIDGAYEATDFFPFPGGKAGGRWLYFMAALIHDSEGNIIGAVETLEDITARKKAEEEQLTLERQVQHAQKLESLGVLAGGIAHDFNNLLASISGNTELALMDVPENSSVREHLNLVVAATQRAADLARQMLAYSGKGQFYISRLDLSKIVNEMAKLLEVSVSKKAEIVYQLTENLPAIEADVTQLRQIVMNLITNASEALSDAPGKITISTDSIFATAGYLQSTRIHNNAPSEGEYVFIEVSDTGCGMDAHTCDHLFDPFFTTKFTGRGLGLSAVAGIVKGHNGAIDVRSTLGKGTCFRILFPASKHPVDTTLPTQQTHGPASQTQAKYILIIDDEASVRDLANKYLTIKGFSTLLAENGTQGIALFRAHAQPIDCVLLDLTMPDMDGYEVFSALRAIQSNIRILMSSGFSEQEWRSHVPSQRLTGFIQKPYRLTDLLKAIQDLLTLTSHV